MIPKELQGGQLVIGDVTIQLPQQGCPDTDEDVINFEALRADIARAMAPSLEVVSAGKAARKFLAEAIDTTFDLRKAEAAEEPKSMFPKPERRAK